MKNITIEFLPDRLNREPIVFRGMTNGELLSVLQYGFIFWLPVCGVVGALWGAAMIGCATSAAMVFISVFFAGAFLQRVKRNRPDGWHEKRLQIFLQQHGVIRGRFILYSGDWDIKRTTCP